MLFLFIFNNLANACRWLIEFSVIRKQSIKTVLRFVVNGLVVFSWKWSTETRMNDEGGGEEVVRNMVGAINWYHSKVFNDDPNFHQRVEKMEPNVGEEISFADDNLKQWIQIITSYLKQYQSAGRFLLSRLNFVGGPKRCNKYSFRLVFRISNNTNDNNASNINSSCCRRCHLFYGQHFIFNHRVRNIWAPIEALVELISATIAKELLKWRCVWRGKIVSWAISLPLFESQRIYKYM